MEGAKRSVCREIKVTSNLICRRLGRFDVENELGVTWGHCRVIGFLLANRGRSVYQKDIEDEFSIRRSTATKLLQSLEKRGFIERRSDESDGRLKRLLLTDKAKETSETGLMMLYGLEKQLLEGVSQEEQISFCRVLDKIRQNAEAMGGEA